jgi:hypothetical protein
MEKILLTKRNHSGFENDLTREMDKHRSYESEISHTYIYDHQLNKGSWALRLPGATRGSIIVDNENAIKDINLYEDTCFGRLGCYKESVREMVRRFVGYKIVFENVGAYD